MERVVPTAVLSDVATDGFRPRSREEDDRHPQDGAQLTGQEVLTPGRGYSRLVLGAAREVGQNGSDVPPLGLREVAEEKAAYLLFQIIEVAPESPEAGAISVSQV
jgi:hypothetical protein